MKSLSGPVITQLANTDSTTSDIKYFISSILYNESIITGYNSSADINVGNYDKVVVTLSKYPKWSICFNRR